jgi:hypothetical protein
MPIRPEMKNLYPPKNEWEALRAARLKAQGNRCLFCRVENHSYRENSAGRMIRIILTIAHLDHDPRNSAPENTPALCQACHNSHDAKHRARGRIEREDARKIAEYNERMKGESNGK